MGDKRHIVKGTIPCDRCTERYELKANEGISPAICPGCKEKEENDEKETFLSMLKEKSLEDRIARLEELHYLDNGWSSI